MSATHERYYWLDGLRCLAAVAVLATHARERAFVEFGALPTEQQTSLVAAAFAATRLGHEAVLLFFVLSGFLVGGSSVERMARASFSVCEYSIDRATRLLIPLFPAVAFSVAVSWLRDQPVTMGEVAANLFGLQGLVAPVLATNAALWSLACEVWFYLLLVAVGYGTSRERNAGAALLLAMLCLGAFARLGWEYLACFGLGALGRARLHGRVPSVLLAPAAVGCALCVIALQLSAKTESVDVGRFVGWLPPRDLSCLAFAFCATLIVRHLAVAAPRSWWAIAVESKSSALSAFSYSLYLTHYPLLRALEHIGLERERRLGLEAMPRFVAILGVCVVFAWLFSMVFERRTATVRLWIKLRVGVRP